MVNTEIRLIIFFATKDGEALYSQQKQDQELTVAHTNICKNSHKCLKICRETGREPLLLGKTKYNGENEQLESGV